MGTKRKKSSGGRKRVRSNIPRAGIKNNGSRYCGGERKKANGGKKSC